MTWLISISRTMALVAIASFLAAGCSSLFKMSNWKNLFASTQALQSVSIQADREVNGGYPLALDIVAVTDATVLNALAGLRASEWFAAKADFQRQHPGKIKVLSWELVPGQHFSDIAMAPETSTVVGVMVYADYLGERSYRASVQDQKKIVIRLRRDDFDVAPE